MLLLAFREESTFSGVVTASSQNSTATDASSKSSVQITRLSIGLGVGVGLLLFAAFWALAFVLWTRRSRKKAAREQQEFDTSAGRPPPVPEKEWSVSEGIRTLHHDLDIMIDQYGRPLNSNGPV